MILEAINIELYDLKQIYFLEYPYKTRCYNNYIYKAAKLKTKFDQYEIM